MAFLVEPRIRVIPEPSKFVWNTVFSTKNFCSDKNCLYLNIDSSPTLIIYIYTTFGRKKASIKEAFSFFNNISQLYTFKIES